VLGAALVIAGAWLTSRSEVSRGPDAGPSASGEFGNLGPQPLGMARRPNRPDDQDTAIPDM
jgi:hypothetical protein